MGGPGWKWGHPERLGGEEFCRAVASLETARSRKEPSNEAVLPWAVCCSPFLEPKHFSLQELGVRERRAEQRVYGSLRPPPEWLGLLSASGD